jgi:hypothetical protein
MHHLLSSSVCVCAALHNLFVCVGGMQVISTRLGSVYSWADEQGSTIATASPFTTVTPNAGGVTVTGAGYGVIRLVCRNFYCMQIYFGGSVRLQQLHCIFAVTKQLWMSITGAC